MRAPFRHYGRGFFAHLAGPMINGIHYRGNPPPAATTMSHRRIESRRRNSFRMHNAIPPDLQTQASLATLTERASLASLAVFRFLRQSDVRRKSTAVRRYALLSLPFPRGARRVRRFPACAKLRHAVRLTRSRRRRHCRSPARRGYCSAMSESTNLPCRRVAMRYFVFRSSKSEQFSMRKELLKIGKWTRGLWVGREELFEKQRKRVQISRGNQCVAACPKFNMSVERMRRASYSMK